MAPVRMGLVGISGIGGYHKGIMHEMEDVALVAAADMWPDRERVQEARTELEAWGVPFYTSMDELLAAETVDAVTIATPHPYHAPYTMEALRRGLHVIVEKPVTVRVQDGFEVVQTARESGLQVGVDFQYTSYPHSLKLKEIICNGELGELREIVGVMEWKRTDEYYLRSDWAGKRYYDGYACWDGVLMNQAVHLLNSALQMGSTQVGLAMPQHLQAEMYRIHDIETEDLAALRADLGECTLHLYATTCCDSDRRTTLDIIGTRGTASWDTSKSIVRIDGKDEMVFDEPTDRNAIYSNFIGMIHGQEKRLFAPAAESVKPTVVINGAYLSAGRIPKLGRELMDGLADLIDTAADERKLFSEMGVDWAYSGEAVEINDALRFEGLSDDKEVCG